MCCGLDITRGSAESTYTLFAWSLTHSAIFHCFRNIPCFHVIPLLPVSAMAKLQITMRWKFGYADGNVRSVSANDTIFIITNFGYKNMGNRADG